MSQLPAHLAAVLGHELRNPLAAAMTGASLLRELLDGGDPRGATVDAVLRDLGRLDRLLNSWLDLARSGQLRRERLDLVALLRAVAAGRSEVAVTSALPTAPVSGDPALLQRAVENLLENARAAGARRVTLRVAGQDGRVRVEIDDDGPGVPLARIHDIFTPGVSSHGSTGLGLPIVLSTITVHGGHVRCEPRADGGRFVVELPLVEAAPARCASA